MAADISLEISASAGNAASQLDKIVDSLSKIESTLTDLSVVIANLSQNMTSAFSDANSSLDGLSKNATKTVKKLSSIGKNVGKIAAPKKDVEPEEPKDDKKKEPKPKSMLERIATLKIMADSLQKNVCSFGTVRRCTWQDFGKAAVNGVRCDKRKGR